MTRHIIVLAFFAWGHMRPELNLAVNIARKIPDLIVSVIADAGFQTNAQAEVERVVGENEKDVLKRIRVIAGGIALAGFTPELMATMGTLDPRGLRIPPASFTEASQAIFHKVMKGEPFQDDNGVSWDGIAPKPSFVITDMFMADVAAPMKEMYHLKTYIYSVSYSATFTRLFGTVAVGGQAEGYVEECDAIEADPERRKGRSFVEIAKHMYAHSGRYPDDVVRVKGMKPFYEWEDFPQEQWSPPMYWAIAGAYPLVKTCDGLLLPSVLTLDGDGTDGVKEWFSRPIFSLGPQLPASYLHTQGSAGSSGSRAEVTVAYFKQQGEADNKNDPSIVFLDEALAKYGANSTLYITFGSMTAPSPEYLGYLFDVLLDLEEPMPFLFAAASPSLQLSESVREKVVASGRGLIVPWAPQQTVFQHPATGWVISHCGAGGTAEALAQGMPLITWPALADQPQNARWMVEVLDTAFELLQVRTGLGQTKAFRGGPNGTEIIGTEEAIKAEMKDVLTRARGEDGKRKRTNAGRVKQLIHEAEAPGGQVDQHFELLNREIL